MPLSEHEQKLLEQLEKQLHEDDPKFANSMGSDPGRSWSTRHVVIGVLCALAGVFLLLVGVTLQNIFVGVLVFVVMALPPSGRLCRPSSDSTLLRCTHSATKLRLA